MENKVVLIKESKWKIIKRFLFLWLVASPILLMVFGEIDQPKGPKAKADSQQYQIVFLALYLLYCSILLVILLIRLFKAYYKSIVRLDEKGITLNENTFFAWADIYDFRTGIKILKYNVLNKNGGNSGRKEIEEKKILFINEQEFFVNEKYSTFTIGEIAEIVTMYKERMSPSVQSEDAVFPQISISKTEGEA